MDRTLSLVDSGIPAVGPIPWGTHFCQFYETKQDLAETLVLYFKRGLDNDEACLWVTAEPLGVEDARSALRTAVPSFERRERAGQIEIIDHRDWYRRSRSPDPDVILQSWIERKEEALAKGYTGLRLTGNTFFLEDHDWHNFTHYEETVNKGFAGHRLTALCSYCLERCKPSGILDVVRNHQFALVRRNGAWEILEDASLKIAKAELARLNEELERRVEERTAELRRALAEKDILYREIHHRVKNNMQVISGLLQMRARRAPNGEVREALRQTLDRVHSMSLVHEALYRRDDVANVGFGDYLRGLCAALAESYGVPDRIALSVSSDDSAVELGMAVPLGMVANEVISNALKHAFPDGRSGRIEVDFRRADEQFLLTVRDDGVGLPPAALEASKGEAGLRLVQALARQVGGRMTIERGVEGSRGTAFRLSVPVSG